MDTGLTSGLFLSGRHLAGRVTMSMMVMSSIVSIPLTDVELRGQTLARSSELGSEQWAVTYNKWVALFIEEVQLNHFTNTRLITASIVSQPHNNCVLIVLGYGRDTNSILLFSLSGRVL